jgi:hypothetical protein
MPPNQANAADVTRRFAPGMPLIRIDVGPAELGDIVASSLAAADGEEPALPL